ncbi:MAG: SDR family NAD(P)-dependent oxidoreductase [Actinobacteria bacterium]|nr:SDR family NAD(P)-dependent oxidoreductase [Actinomycetota bacterium]
MTNDRIALVTGASRGLGLEMCRQLAARGVTVLLSARDLASAHKAAEIVRADGGDCRPIALDVTDAGQIAAVAAELDSSYGRLDVLVNNAAILTDLGVQPSATDEAVLRANLDVNFVGPFMLIAALSPLLRRSDGARVLNLGTQVGSFGNLDDTRSPLVDDICPAYQASKIALNAATALFAKELRQEGITVNSLCPGWVMTDMGHEDLPDYGDAVAPMSPTEAVAQMLWLVEDEPSPPTGRFWSQGEEIPW